MQEIYNHYHERVTKWLRASLNLQFLSHKITTLPFFDVDHNPPFNLLTRIRLEPSPSCCELRTTTTKLVLLLSFEDTFRLSHFLYYDISFTYNSLLIPYNSIQSYFLIPFVTTSPSLFMAKGQFCMWVMWRTCTKALACVLYAAHVVHYNVYTI